MARDLEQWNSRLNPAASVIEFGIIPPGYLLAGRVRIKKWQLEPLQALFPDFPLIWSLY